MQLMPDYSLLVQMAIFIALWQALKYILFDPFQKVLQEREHRTTGTHRAAEELREGAERAREQYEAALHEARVRLGQESEASRKAAQEEQSKAINEARRAAGEELARMRSALAEQVEQARRTLAAEANTIAFEMLDRVTGRSAA